jgi:hypothetical protein
VLTLVKVGGPIEHRPPSTAWLVLATFGSLAGSLGVCALLVVVAETIFPSTKGYGHFQFSDYGTLTAVGVIAACVAWPIVTKLCTVPRWLFFRLAILTTLVLWLPDLYILAKGQPPKAVTILMVMHLAIAVVTYNLLVRVATVRSAARRASGRSAPSALTHT